LTLVLPNLTLLDMAVDNTLTFTSISLTSANLDGAAVTVVPWTTSLLFSTISQEDWNPGPGGGSGGGGSARPASGFLYPRGQG
jgi:hypothetical protein